jgi:hypothetical protein
LTIFIIAVVDWTMGKAFGVMTLAGGVLIIMAFGMLSWASWKEIQEDKTDVMDVEGA